MNLQETIKKNSKRYLKELIEFLRIPSISTDAAYKNDIQKAADFLSQHFEVLGAEQITIHQTPGHPIVTAQFGQDPSKPTVLVYGHYDVQPEGNPELWDSPAFKPEIRGSKIYGRGTTDDKGQVFTYLKAVELMQKDGPLPCNVRFLIEGEEEIGSDNLPQFLKEHPEIIKGCTAATISDTAIIDEETPAITVGLRGHIGVQVTVKGPAKELHSGYYGGAVANPIEALSKMIASVTDDKGRIQIPGFYDGIREFSDEERALMNWNPHSNQIMKDETGVEVLIGEEGYTPLERTGIRPAFTPISIHAGPPTGSLKGVISPEATALIALRIVPGQNPEKICQDLIAFLKSKTPEGVTLEAKNLGASSPWALSSFDDPAYKAATRAYTTAWGKQPVPLFIGGSIPIVAMLDEAGASPTLMGFGLGSDNLHSPNEHISINRFQKGIETLVHFFRTLPEEIKNQEISSTELE